MTATLFTTRQIRPILRYHRDRIASINGVRFGIKYPHVYIDGEVLKYEHASRTGTINAPFNVEFTQP